LYKGWLKYVAPFISSIELIFGLWIVVVFFAGLTPLSISEQLNIFLKFANELFFTQFVVVALLILFVKYAQFFFSESKKNEETN
jgi:low affinity Fe/Cu permease